MSRGVVFITGASSGIGRATAIRLAKAGYDVIPGLRRDEPLPDPVRKPVLIDLGKPDTIGPATEEVLTRADGNLVGLVNNAGISVAGPVETLGVDRWREQFEVNLFGHLAITKALLPALLENQGRVINIGSVGGRMSLPFLGPYNASKFAVRAWTDSMRIELAPQGVTAVLIEPGSIDTSIWEKGTAEADEMVASLTDDQRRRYDKQIEGVLKAADFAASHATPVDKCAAVIERAMTAKRPKGRYLVGADAHVQAAIAAMPTRVIDGFTRTAARQPRRKT
jgi:NAD(P)-dependent dehydrogenase (short-subunit alcohol dehydrogenase family)